MRRSISRVTFPWQLRHCSFVAAAYRGRIAPEEIFPFPTSELEAHVREAMMENRSTLLNQETRSNTDVWGMLSPEDLGGLELPFPCVFDVLSQSSPQSYLNVHEHAFLATFLIRTFASKEHKGRYLPAMSDASTQVAWAASERASPNDPAECRCSATFEEATSTYIISGEKIVNHQSPTAFLSLVNITSGPATGLAWFWIANDTPGVEFSPGILRLKNAKVPMDAVVVPAGDAYRACMTSLFAAATATSAIRVAALRSSTCPDEATAIYALESMGAALSANIQRGKLDTFLESVATLSFADSVQCLNIQPSYRQLAAIERYSLSTDVLAKAGACCGVEDAALVFNKTSTLETMQTRSLAAFGFVDQLPEVDFPTATRTRIAMAINKFGTVVRSFAVRHGSTSTEREIAGSRLNLIATLLFSTVAVVSRSHRAISGKVSTAEVERHLAVHWIELAMAQVDVLLSDALSAARTADDAHARLCADVLNQ